VNKLKVKIDSKEYRELQMIGLSKKISMKLKKEEMKKIEKERVKATLRIFSGRRNPQWTLNKKQINELKTKLESLPLSDTEVKIPSHLGYTGILVYNPRKILSLPERIIAYKKILAITKNGETKYYQDKNRVEEWLLHQARKYTTPKDLIDDILSSIRK